MSKVGDAIIAPNADWSFGGEVAQTFDDHVEKSVPFYHEAHTLIAEVSDFFLARGSLGYEIGCSTGTLLRELGLRNQSKDVKLIGIDREAGMIRKAIERCRDLPNVQAVQADIVDYDLKPCDMIVAYYTIQFIKPKVRQLLFDQIYEALNWGGAFVLFEKVRGPDARFQDIMTALYTDYKLRQGYSEAEIVHKTRSLKGVLEPFSTQGNMDLLKRAGFVDIMTIFKYVTFEGFLAIK